MIAIKVQNIGKRFKLFASPGRRFLEYISLGKVIGHTDFWALNDISFEIPRGTTLGILGQNGSGKSTLLSILAGVLYPSAGSFEIQGKVSAILELGSGFHPEFSGRDNIYMYGSIMGLSKSEIDTRFEEIVQFSELGDFINQPLRTYSSGMIVRLAFSVAVHVDADILIVDEALAVGDTIFQHRCFRKIREMQTNGKTILYVGHDCEVVKNLCTQALLLDGGRIIERGNPNYVVNKYFALITERERASSEENLEEHGAIPGEGFETVYNFVQKLDDAEVNGHSGMPVCEQTVEINEELRTVILAYPPSEIKYSVFIPQGSIIAFAIGILPSDWDKVPEGVKFEIEIQSWENVENIFSRVLQPNRNSGDRGWHNYLLSSECFSNTDISIIFRTSGSEGDLRSGCSAWGWGRIMKPVKNGILENKAIGNPSEFLQYCRYGNNKAEFQNVEILDTYGSPKQSFKAGEEITIRYKMVAYSDFVDCLTIGFIIRNKFTDIYGTNTRWKKCDLCNVKKGPMPTVSITMSLSLGTGTYSLTSAIAIVHPGWDVEVLDRREDHIFFQVQNDVPMTGLTNLDAKIKIE